MMVSAKNNISGRVKSFEDWIDYVFNHPVTEPAWYFKDIEKDNWVLSEDAVVEYMTRLFANPAAFLEPFSNAQVNQGLQYLVSPSCSSQMFALLNESVSWEKRKEALLAIYALFERYFVKYCANVLARDEKRKPLNNVCFMWWDVFPWHGRPKEPKYAEIDGLILSVMEKILFISHTACQESALHGLGHWQISYPERVKKIIDDFLARNPEMLPELREYALRARTGRIQ